MHKDRQTGEKELFELAYTSKHEGSWAHILGGDTWINLTADFEETITRDSVKFSVESRVLPNSIFDGNLVFYHIHPKAAFDISLKKMKKMKMVHSLFPELGRTRDVPEYKAYGYLMDTFHLPSVPDIKTAVTLTEKHGSGLHFIIISNVGASVTRIRNPPVGESKKLSIEELTSQYESIHNMIPKFDPKPGGSILKSYYGLFNEQTKGYIQIADLTSITSLFMRPEDHAFMRWLSTGRPIKEQYRESRIHYIALMFGNDPDYESTIEELSKATEKSNEVEKISTRVHQECSKALAQFVGVESADAYAKFQIRCMRDFYSTIDASALVASAF